MGANKRKERLVALSSIVRFQATAPGQTRRALHILLLNAVGKP